MGLFSKLFGNKKKKEETSAAEGQEQFLKEEHRTPAAPKVEMKKEEPKAAEAPKAEVKKTAAPKVEAKKEEPSAAEAPKAEVKKTAAPKVEAKKPVKEEIPKEEEISADDEEVTVEASGKPSRNGKFDIRKSKDGRFYFNLYASNKQVIAYSQMYASIGSAMTGIKSVMANATKAQIEDTTLKKPEPKNFPKWEIYIDKAGEYRFRLYATNGSCICHSHGYASKATCKGGMESIQRFASESADIDKSYLNK